MPVFDYVCKKCGAKTELTERKENARHLVDGKVCGTFRRNWTSVNVNTTNLRAARG